MNTTLIGASLIAFNLNVNNGSSAIPEDNLKRLTSSSPYYTSIFLIKVTGIALLKTGSDVSSAIASPVNDG
jgi:hypothetical protein